MKKKTRNLLALALALTMAWLLLAACGGAAKEVPLSDVVTAIDKALDKGDNLVSIDAAYIKGYMKLDVADYAGYTVKINAYGTNIDEYGVFQAADSAQAKAVKEALEAYLQTRLDGWMDEYMPEEKPKLTAAEVKTNGNYVMYAILSDSDKKLAFDAFDAALK